MEQSIEPVIAKENVEEDPLLSRLSTATQFKAPTERKEAEWNFDLDVKEMAAEAEKKETDPAATDKDPDPKAEPKAEAKPAKITDAAKRSSARTAVNMLDLTQKGLFTPLITRKYKKKFTPEEQERILVNETKKKKDLSEEDQLLGAKFEKMMLRMNKKLDAVPLEETEKQDLEEAFYSYFDFKEKTLPPEWFVGLAITNSIGKRAIDLLTD